jgi:hypothetical protein
MADGKRSIAAGDSATIAGVRFLVQCNAIAPAVKAALVRHGHGVDEFAFVDLTAAELLEQLHVKQLDLVTDDAELVKAAGDSPPARFGRCVVYLQLSGGEVEQDDAIDRLFGRYKRLSPRKIYTVTETRVKVRQMRS